MVVGVSQPGRALIEHQRGVLARWQMADRTSDLAAVDALVRSGRWQTLYRGVYTAYTGPPSRQSALWAAVLRCGPEAALSHFTAAELDGLADDQRDPVHVTVPAQAQIRMSDRGHPSGAPAIVVHRSARLSMTRHPARTPPRTRTEETVLDLVELAPSFDGAFHWLSAACGRRLVTPAQLRAAAGCRAKLRWRDDVLVAIEEISDGIMSNLERGYVRRVERPHRLPRPNRQCRRRQGGRSAYLDNLYEDLGLAVELDGLAAHPAESRWRDMRRDSFFASSGIITLRYSWADITTRPCQVAREIGLVLRQRGWTGALRACRASCQAGLP
jgi:very-short-patch-repair endonuclease